jgi:hypothetical protein
MVGGEVPETLRTVDLAQLVAAVETRLSPAETLSEAAQSFADCIYETFPAELALVRTYAMVPGASLPADRRASLAAQGHDTALVPEARVLTLLGTRGIERSWNEPRRSRNHLCIPFTKPEAVMAVPMMAALLTQLGLELSWIGVTGDVFARRLVGGFNGLFYVADAARASDDLGRLIIPAQDFVAANRIVTVFGQGGAYLDGTIVASIFFSREALSRTDAERFAPLASMFKSRTSRLVASGHIFP